MRHYPSHLEQQVQLATEVNTTEQYKKACQTILNIQEEIEAIHGQLETQGKLGKHGHYLSMVRCAMNSLSGRYLNQAMVATGIVLLIEAAPQLQKSLKSVLRWPIEHCFSFCTLTLDPYEIGKDLKQKIINSDNFKFNPNLYHLRSGVSYVTVKPCDPIDHWTLCKYFEEISWKNPQYKALIMQKGGGGQDSNGEYARSFDESLKYIRKGAIYLVKKIDDPSKDANRVEIDIERCRHQFWHILSKLPTLSEQDRAELLCQLACEGGHECNRGVAEIIDRIYKQLFHFDDLEDDYGNLMGVVHRFLRKKRAALFWQKIHATREAVLLECVKYPESSIKQSHIPGIISSMDVHVKNYILRLFHDLYIDDFDEIENIRIELIFDTDPLLLLSIDDIKFAINHYMNIKYFAQIPQLLEQALSQGRPSPEKPIDSELFSEWLKQCGLSEEEASEIKYFVWEDSEKKYLTEDEMVSIKGQKIECEKKYKPYVFFLFALSMRAIQLKESDNVLSQ